MPVKKCVQRGIKLFCYNKAQKNVSVFREEIYELNECPLDIIAAFISEDYDVSIQIDEKEKLMSKEELDRLLLAIDGRSSNG